MNQRVGEMLSGLQSKLRDLVQTPLEGKPAHRLGDAVKGRKADIKNECAALLETLRHEVVSHIREQLLSRECVSPIVSSPVRGGSSPQDVIDLVDDTYFGLSRFPEFIAAVMSRLDKVMSHEEAAIMQSVTRCVDNFYGEMSPFVRMDGCLTGDRPWMRVCVEPNGGDQLVWRVILDADLASYAMNIVEARLLAGLGEVADNVSVAGWTEECAQERRGLQDRMDKLRKARKGMCVCVCV